MPFNLPRVIKALLIANVVVFLLQLIAGGERMAIFELWPLGASDLAPGVLPFMPWQLVTSGFMHDDFGHLFFNMFALVMFGAQAAYVWGEKRFLVYYFVCVIGASLCQLVFAAWSLEARHAIVHTVGASGGVYGLVLAYGMLFPNQKITFFPIPVMMTARTVAILYAVTALAYGVMGSQAGVGHFAHLGGMLFGWLLIRHWRGQWPFGGGKPKPPRMRIVP